MPLLAEDRVEPRGFRVATLSAAAAAGGRPGQPAGEQPSAALLPEHPAPPAHSSVRQGAIRVVPKRAGARVPPPTAQWHALVAAASPAGAGLGAGSGSGHEAASQGELAPGTPATLPPPYLQRGGSDPPLRLLWGTPKASAAPDGAPPAAPLGALHLSLRACRRAQPPSDAAAGGIATGAVPRCARRDAACCGVQLHAPALLTPCSLAWECGMRCH